MDNYQMTWYMQEIAMHSYGAEHDAERLLAILEDPGTIQSRLVWFHLSSLLAHAAMISKFLAPISRSAAARGADLKAALGVAAASEVLSRNARDNSEHFDERMDNWVEDGAQTIMEVVVPNRQGFNFLAREGTRIRRVLLKDELIYVSENRDGSRFELELRPLIEETTRIGRQALQWIEDNSPYAFIYPGR